jgi:nitrogenase-stabilizing/protective protein
MSEFLDRLALLSSAEQILDAIGLPYEQCIVDVHRLHILKRFRHHLDPPALAEQDEDIVRAACSAAMAKAYEEFAEGTPGPRTFRVFQQCGADQTSCRCPTLGDRYGETTDSCGGPIAGRCQSV